MTRLGPEVVRPLLHERPAPYEQIGPCVGLLDAAAQLMRQGRLTGRPGRVRLLHRPCLERRSEPVHCRPVRKAVRAEYLRHRHVAQHPAGAQRRREAEPRTHLQAAVPASMSQAPRSLSGTRCSMPAFMREPGIVHVAPSRSISSHVAPLASPERAAVNTRNLRHCFAACEVWDASTVLSADPTSS